MVQLTEFDMADYLNTDEEVAEYIRQILEDGDNEELAASLRHLAKARGLSKPLQEELCSSTHLKFSTVQQVCRALGVTITTAIMSKKTGNQKREELLQMDKVNWQGDLDQLRQNRQLSNQD